MTSDSAFPPIKPSRGQYWAILGLLILILVGTLLAAPWHRSILTSNVRVRNESSVPIGRVIVGGTPYGDIAPGAYTEYKRWGPAYPHPKVEFVERGVYLRQVPDDQYGEVAIGWAELTYTISLKSDAKPLDFTVMASKD